MKYNEIKLNPIEINCVQIAMQDLLEQLKDSYEDMVGMGFDQDELINSCVSIQEKLEEIKK